MITTLVIYIIIGMLITIPLRLYDGEPQVLGVYLVVILIWPVFLLVLLSKIKL